MSERVSNCPWAMCEVNQSDHSYCAKVFATRVEEYTKRLEKKVHPKGRCIFCDAGEHYWKHRIEYIDREGSHTFIGEFERIDPEFQFEEWKAYMKEFFKKHPNNTMADNNQRIYNWRATRISDDNWRIDIGY